MSTKQIIAYGGKVERSLNGTTWTSIPEVKGIAVPEVTQEYVEVTSLDSPNGYKEYIKGLKDAGEITLLCGYTSDGYDQMVQDQAANQAIYYRVTMALAPGQTVADEFEYLGYPTPTLKANGIGEAVDMELKLRITGAPTFTPGS